MGKKKKAVLDLLCKTPALDHPLGLEYIASWVAMAALKDKQFMKELSPTFTVTPGKPGFEMKIAGRKLIVTITEKAETNG